MRVAVLLLVFLLAGPALAGEAPVAGAFGPLEETVVELEHVVVRYDLEGPTRARVRLDACLFNPGSESVRTELMLLAPDPGSASVELDGTRVPTETVTGNRDKTSVVTFPVSLPAGGRVRVTARLEVASGEVRTGGREFLYRMPARSRWGGYSSATVLVHGRRGWALATHPPTSLLSSGPDDVVYGASLGPNQADWVRIQVAWNGLPILFWVVGVPAVVSLAAGSLALAWRGPGAVRGLLLAYLFMTPAYLWMRAAGLLAWHPGPLPIFLCFVLGPVLAAGYAALARRSNHRPSP
ncbi:MAG: hypothetical protein AB1758_14110 [Candidatus Eremiobacterota bacterium]